MARALERVKDCEILGSHPRLSFRKGQYSYQIVREGDRSIYIVTDGKTTLRAPLAWAFGLGSAGQTYVYGREGAWYESRVSYYKEISGLDITMGRDIVPKSVDEAAGRRMDTLETKQCFNCHSTGAVHDNVVTLNALTPGVQCERCHGLMEEHFRAFNMGGVKTAAMRKLAQLNTEQMADFCGQCHRTWSQVAMEGPKGIFNIRFQPYRLTNSKCYDAEDRRISCVACHNPHIDPVDTVSAYDSKCLACHEVLARLAQKTTCPVAKANCVTCHMPKHELPGSHKYFTDHQIRIVRAGDPYPN